MTRVCTACNAEASSSVVHCSRCDVCLDRHDHHCVWTSKCVAAGNQAEFVSFVALLAFGFVYVLALSIVAVAAS